jgi:SAM-dependent methyltransferase
MISLLRKNNLTLLQMAKRRVEIFYEKLNGLDFSSVIPVKKLGFDESIVFKSSPSGNKFLSNLLADLKINSNDRILDIGCAKGSAIRCMLKFPFAAVDGVEISKELSSIATENFKKLNKINSEIFNANAIEFTKYGSYNFFYLYNPFPESIMEKVMVNLNKQILKKHEVIIIYNNPKFHKTIESAGYTVIRKYPDQWGNGIFVYSNCPESSRIGAF